MSLRSMIMSTTLLCSLMTACGGGNSEGGLIPDGSAGSTPTPLPSTQPQPSVSPAPTNEPEPSQTPQPTPLATPTPSLTPTPTPLTTPLPLSFDAGPDTSIGLSETLNLAPTLPAGATDTSWRLVNGPGQAEFSNANSATSQVSFSWAGDYQLLASTKLNGELQEDTLNVKVSNYLAPVPLTSGLMKLNPSIYFSFENNATTVENGKQLSDMPNRLATYLFGGSNTPATIAGAKGKAWNFNGADRWLSVYGGASYDIGTVDTRSGISIAFWVKHTYEDAQDRNDRIAGSVVDITLDRWGGEEGRIKFCFSGDCYPTERVDQNPLDGTWRHVALSVDYSKSTDNIRIYQDGILNATRSAAITSNFNAPRTDKHLVIGTRHVNPQNHIFRGALDDFAVFDYPLTSGQVEQLFNYTAGETQHYVTDVDAGRTITQVRSNLSVTLNGRVENNNPSVQDLKPHWRFVKGPSAVTIANPNQLDTNVAITPPPDGHYHHYIFELAVDEGMGYVRSDQVSVVLHKERDIVTRTLSPVPAAGIHPRILFTAAELPAIRERFDSSTNTALARTEIAKILDSTLYNASHPIGQAFDKLKAGDLSIDYDAVIDSTNVSRYGDGQNEIFAKLMIASLVALINNDDTHGKELATAFAHMVTLHSERFELNLNNFLHHNANPDIAMTYDLAYNWMTVEQRNATRGFLAHMCNNRRAFGTGEIDQSNSTNWRGHHDHVVICSLAIEGEEGYDPNVFESNIDRLRKFMTGYGIHESGKPHEAIGYFTFGQIWASRTALATAMRDENFFITTPLAEVNEVFFRQTSPWGDFIFDHDDSVSGTLSHPSPSDWIAKYMYPSDLMVDYRIKVLRDAALRTGDSRKFLMTALLFGLDLDEPNADISLASTALNLPLSYFDKTTGYLNTRTSWSPQATRVEFRSKQDLYFLGHIHSDRNAFEVQSHGRDWLIDPGKFMDANDYSQTILIDGLGQSNSEAKRRWPPMPGVFVDYIDNTEVTFGAGDAKANYDFHRQANVEGDTYVDSPYTWADFTFDQPDLPVWFSDTKVQSSNNKLGVYNPVEKAFRSLALVRGEHPYILVIDDIEKDNSPHTYEWVGNMANDFHTLQYETVELLSATESDALVRYVDDTGPGTPRFLLKVLEAQGDGSTIALKTRDNLGQFGNFERKWLSVERSNVVNPQFKMLLYPHNDGDEQPTTQWNGRQLTITIGDQVDTIDFDNSDARTRMRITREGQVLMDNR